MNLFSFNHLTPELKIYLTLVVPFSLMVLSALILRLRELINRQVDDQVERFADEARIPKIFRRFIVVNLKWR